MNPIVDLQNVTKSYRDKLVLDAVSLSIPTNQVTAIVGKNGSGKSTLLKLIGGLIKADRGEILYRNGEPVRFGYVPEVTPTYIPFTPIEYLTHMGTIRGLQNKWLQQRIHTLLEIFHMKDNGNNRIVHFSKGMKQKVTIMQAMLEETDLLIMDEPLSGLDLEAQTEMEELLISLKERNISVVLTCHETKLLQRVVDQIIVIDQCNIIQTENHQAQEKSMNRLIFELTKTVSIDSIKQQNVIIKQEKEMGFHKKMIELNVSEEHTNKIVSEFLDRGASIKLLEPLHKKETEFLNQF
ncbi:ABC transporter ATP-binding protein [Fictibacillus nanhaiensis]|uniref:ABC transporter ATP-binding protein n=1 Tax=Fictibacillus nanhaiensis TaxID=742169 RepID=A0ABS2ZWA2_9BACL|nr:ABC transporter ATP-binding protein [Fictibacillus nanhaiensis]